MESERLDLSGFRDLVSRVADNWAALNAAGAADCFTADAVYMEPPDRQLFRGKEELLAYFSPLEPGTYLEIDSIWFDEAAQSGAIEFSFGVAGRPNADHGVAILQIQGGLISSWREYQRPGPAGFDDFTAIDGKDWEWHAGNYP